MLNDRFVASLPGPGRAADVKVLGDHVHVVRAVAEHALRPAGVAGLILRARVAYANQYEVRIDLPHRPREAVVLEQIVVQTHKAQLPRAEHLIAHAPVLDVDGLGRAILRTPRAADRVCRCVAVLELLRGRVVVAKSRICGDHRLCTHRPAETDELVDADVVVFDTGPGRVLPRRSPVARAYTGTPATEYRFDLLDVRTEANTNANYAFGLEFYQADDGTLISDAFETIDLSVTGDGLSFDMSATAPAGTAFVRPVIKFDNAVSAEQGQENVFVFTTSMTVVPEPAAAFGLLAGALCLLRNRLN
jgi:hypothetical protein